MATGYTADITKDTTLADFAMKCARAFGALILMRDDPMDAPIPEFAPSTRNEERKLTAAARIAEIARMTPAQCEAEADKEWSATAKRRAESKAESDQKRAAYEAVLAKVQAWTPPTPDHEGLKKFMADQLTESIKFDCHNDAFLETCYPLVRKTGAEWQADALAAARRDLAYYTDEAAKEIARTDGRNKWVRDLRDSPRK